MKKILFSLFLFGFSFFVSHTYAALVAPSNIKQDSATGNSITFSWDEVPDALGYYLYWGKNDVSEHEEVAPIDGTSFTLGNLEANTTYKVSLSSIDSNGGEGEKSQPQSFSTNGQTALSPSGASSSSQDFQLTDVKVLDEYTLQFLFNSDLETASGAQRDFIVDNATTQNELPISSTEVDAQDNSILKVTLSSPLQVSTTYDVTVLAIKDNTGRTIENGIDAVTNFTTPADFSELLNLNSAGDESGTTLQETGTGTSESVSTTSTQQSVENTGGPGGKVLATDTTEKHTIVAAKQNDNLPKT